MVNIKGIIGTSTGEVNLPSIIEQVQNQPEGDLHVQIDSIGGDLDVGFAIYNYLLSQPRKVVTECTGSCASAASIIFLAGDVRIAGCPIMIHNPYIQEISGDKQTLQAMAEWIGEKERQAEAIYARHTKLDEGTLSSLMDDETYISPAQAVAFGFATQAKQIALARLDKPDIIKNETKMSTQKKTIGDIIRQGWGVKLRKRTRAYNMDLTTANGDILTVDREDGAPQVGDPASPDGSHIMADGMTIVVEGGVITEIVEATNEGEAGTGAGQMVDAIQAIVSELQSEVEALKAELSQAKALAKSVEDIKVLNAVKMAGGADRVFKGFRGIYKPQARIGVQGKSEIQGTSRVSEKLALEKEKRGIN